VPALAYVTRIGDIPGTALLEAMIKMGVDLSRFGIDGLLAAAVAKNTDAAARLLEFGIPIDGDATRSPLLEAAEAGAVDMVEFLLARGAVPVDPARVTLAELTPIDLLAFDQGQQSAALDTAGIAIRERLGALRARQRAAIALLEAARSR
jgi:ankyrin repeat protein